MKNKPLTFEAPSPKGEAKKNKPLSIYKKKKLIESYCDELTATQAAHRLNLDRNTVNKYFKRIRESIAAFREYQKMRLLISIMKEPGRKAEIVSRLFPSSNPEQNEIPVHLMYIDGQLLTDIHAHPLKETTSYMYMADYFGDKSPMETSLPADMSNGDLQRIADDFYAFAQRRFKKYFGIKSDFVYLYIKEAEFIFNEKDARKREELLNKMMERIF